MISPLPIYVVDLFGEVVTKVSAIVTPKLQVTNPEIQHVQYMHGHFVEIAKRLAQFSKGSSDDLKYPLIALFQDFAEVKSGTIGIDSEVSLHVIIATLTDANYQASDRYEKTFKTILYPVYYELIKQLQKSKAFMHAGDIPHTKIDRLFWGTETVFANTEQIINDYADCIEIQNLQLKVKPIKC